MNIIATITLGRAPENDVVLPGLSISRQHAAIDIFRDGRLRLRDCSSKHGTWILVNSEWRPVAEEFIGPDDRFRFATTEMGLEDILSLAGPDKKALAQRALASASATMTFQNPAK